MSSSCNYDIKSARQRADISDSGDEITMTALRLMSMQERRQGKLLLHV